jgi:hypothetical protein
LWFAEWEPNGDDLGLFNPIYMYVQTGHLTYPIYDEFNEIIIHPPTQDFVLALIMRATGLTVEGASVVPLAVWVTVAVLMLLCSPFSQPARFGFLFAIFVGIIVWAPLSYIRPDAHQAAASSRA